MLKTEGQNKPKTFDRVLEIGKDKYCGSTIHSKLRYPDAKKRCCGVENAGDMPDCDAAAWPKGPAFNEMIKMTRDENLFFWRFH